MWVNGMFYVDNLLLYGLLDEELFDMEIYGYDFQGLLLVGIDNDVVIDIVDFGYGDLLKFFVLEYLDLLRLLIEMGVEIYIDVLELLVVFQRFE